MVSYEITFLLYLCVWILVLHSSTALSDQHDFKYISYRDLQSSVTTFQAEDNSSFSQMLFDVSRNQMFLGARDGFFRLSLTQLSLLEYVNWESSEQKRHSCIEKGQSDENCHNFINIILSNDRELLICGTNSFSPQCSWREIDNITNVIKIVDGVAQSPFNPNANITALLSENGYYYFGGPADAFGSQSLISKSSENTVVLRTKPYNNFWLNEPQFVGSFESDRFVYFLFRESAVEYMNCGKVIYSRIARICKNDNGGGQMFKDNWTTYIKARLNCSISGDYPFYFHEIQGMFYVPSENVVYASFSTSSNSIAGSAVCAFNITAINKAFEGPFKYQQDIDSGWNKHMNLYRNHFNCESSQKNVNLLDISKYQLMDSAVQATAFDPLYSTTGERFTHITVDVVETKLVTVHVIYLATQQGYIKKLSLLPHHKTACVVEIWQAVPDANIPITSMQFLKKTNSVYITSPLGLSQISVGHCRRHSSLEGCKNAMDPYCGWNEMEETCALVPEDSFRSQFGKPEITSCPVLNTPVNGGWSAWSNWAPCFHKSLSDYNSSDHCLCQTRQCNNPVPANKGKTCVGPSISVTNCTVHGGWSDWSAWSACSATCGTAVKSRTRTCTNPAPAFGGRVCVGQDRSEALCTEYAPCPSQPVDGGWGPWSPWTSCTASCAGGYQLRQRKCDNPTPHNGGQHCKGNDIEYERCNDVPCNEIKKFYSTDWINTNGTSYHKKRYKIICRAPVKSPIQIKISVKEEEKYCSNSQCSNDDYESSWNQWSNWSDCSVSCGGGTQKRVRTCKKTRNCVGESTQTKDCNTHSCEEAWGCWSEWSPCNVSCGWGVKIRTRSCLGKTCNDVAREEQPCEDQPCEAILGWGNWTEWSLCDINNEQHRKRKCFHENPGPLECQGKDFETRICFGELSNEISSIQNTLLEQESCFSVGLSFFFVGVIVGLLPYLAYLIYNHIAKKKLIIPSSPHYISAQQNSYILVPTKKKLPKKRSFSLHHSSSGTGVKGEKFFPPDFDEIPTTLKRSSHEDKNVFNNEAESDRWS
ncbi:unnamed protein product [Diabrotica balteata]|uniref:Sema domain-containing protein n=1 Tax=Diabrotica balteata TaxID=107213 RepID=A0A9N9X602_DIABA|nr:unnamed protein product [Diabrotica balteata]